MIYNPGLLVGPLSGTAGNITASNNKFATFLFPARQVLNQQTPERTKAQAALSAAANNWRLISPTDVTDWNNYAATGLLKGRFGVTYKLTGYLAFQRSNTNLALIAQPPITSPPINPPPESALNPTLTAVSPDFGSPQLVITWSNTPLPADVALLVYAYSPTSAGGTGAPIGGPKLLGYTSLAQASPVDFYAAYVARHGTFHAGEQLTVKLVTVSTEGLAGYRTIAGAIAT